MKTSFTWNNGWNIKFAFSIPKNFDIDQTLISFESANFSIQIFDRCGFSFHLWMGNVLQNIPLMHRVSDWWFGHWPNKVVNFAVLQKYWFDFMPCHQTSIISWVEDWTVNSLQFAPSKDLLAIPLWYGNRIQLNSDKEAIMGPSIKISVGLNGLLGQDSRVEQQNVVDIKS